MKSYLAVIAISVLGACSSGASSTGGAAPGAPTAPSTPTTPTTPTTPVDTSFRGMLNDVRASNGAGPLSYDARLGAAAQGHADDMLANNYFSHTGLNGSSPGDRITATGYVWRTYGENIAKGQTSEEQVLQGWTNSPGHHANNINPAFEDYALAKAGSGSNTYWVLVLATEM